jgi:hypothetical protein
MTVYPGRAGVQVPYVERVVREVMLAGEAVPVVWEVRRKTRLEQARDWGRFGPVVSERWVCR